MGTKLPALAEADIIMHGKVLNPQPCCSVMGTSAIFIERIQDRTVESGAGNESWHERGEVI